MSSIWCEGVHRRATRTFLTLSLSIFPRWRFGFLHRLCSCRSAQAPRVPTGPAQAPSLLPVKLPFLPFRVTTSQPHSCTFV